MTNCQSMDIKFDTFLSGDQLNVLMDISSIPIVRRPDEQCTCIRGQGHLLIDQGMSQ